MHRSSRILDFWQNIKNKFPKAELNGDLKNRLPNNINMHLPGVKAQEALIKLDLAGFAVSSGSACSARLGGPSHVIKALGYKEDRAQNSLRITFGRPTKKDSVDKLLESMLNLSGSKIGVR